MNTMTAISVLELMPSTTQQIETFAQQVKNNILNGEVDYRKFLYQKRLIEKTLEAISEDKSVKEYIENEMEKEHGQVGFNDLTFKLENRKSWDFSNTSDSQLFRLQEEKVRIDEEIKARQKMLKTLKKPIADPETGEIINPPAYSEKTFIRTLTTNRQ